MVAPFVSSAGGTPESLGWIVVSVLAMSALSFGCFLAGAALLWFLAVSAG